MESAMPVHDVRRRLLRGLVSGSSSTSAAAITSAGQHNHGDGSGIDTPSGHVRRLYSAAANAMAPSSIQEDTFYGLTGDDIQTPDNMPIQPTSPGHRMRRKLPVREGVQRHGQYVQGQHRGLTGSPGLGSSTSIEQTNVLDYRNDIVVRDPVTNEPNMVVLETDVPLSEEIQENEVMEYRIRKHLRNVYRNPKRQLEDISMLVFNFGQLIRNSNRTLELQLLVQRDLKRIVQQLDEDAWMFEPDQEISSDLV
ncbi:uncharacterized protein V1513DRAFT_435504 [Lipomyces chichibuensis]|uniref:uncharacterized protein n=1 Tax=Lipomyces chichibuensis TaxID=1546026 RepID=UPI00334383BA